MSPLLWAVGLLSHLACETDTTCVETGCGAREVCESDTCRSVECVSSRDCEVHEYCDDAGFTCEAGCQSDTDCAAGESCASSDHQCFQEGCRSSVLDCGLGQTCDAATAECVDGPACLTCTGTVEGECGTGACEEFPVGDSAENYCILPCLVAGGVDECPRGLECMDLSGLGDLYCYTDCPVFAAELAESASE